MLASKKIIALVPITDAARAKAFYAEKLGLKFVSEDPFAVVFDANGIMLRLTKVKSSSRNRLRYWAGRWQTSRRRFNGCKRLGSSLNATAYFMKQDELGIWTAPDGTHAWPGSRTLTATRSAFCNSDHLTKRNVPNILRHVEVRLWCVCGLPGSVKALWVESLRSGRNSRATVGLDRIAR